MPEQSLPNDPGAVWRQQPEEEPPVNPESFVPRRTRQLYSSTRSEILMSLGAAVFFAAVIAMRFNTAGETFPPLGFVGVLAWVLISLYWFRDRIWRRRAVPGDALAAPGVEHYRRELERRRDHLRNEWLWHGPLVLACATCLALFGGKAFPALDRLRNVAPLVVLLAVWMAFGVVRRRRQANEIQREIAEIGSLLS